MTDWYTEGLHRIWRCSGWTLGYAIFSGHFVDDFGNMVRVYLPDEEGRYALMT